MTMALFISSFVYASEQKQKTEIVGDKMIIKDKGKTAYFKGHANVKRGNYNITSNEMIYYRATDDVDAKGNVNFLVTNEDGSVIKAKAENAQYNTKLLNGKMWGNNPVVEYELKNSTDTIYLYMDMLYLNDNFEIFFLEILISNPENVKSVVIDLLVVYLFAVVAPVDILIILRCKKTLFAEHIEIDHIGISCKCRE